MAPTFSNPGTTVIRPASLAHIVLRTRPEQFKPMVSYYKTFLSASVRFENEAFCFLSYDSEHHRVAIIAIPGTLAPVLNSSGLLHFALTFPSLTDLTLAYLQRKAHGIEPYWCVNHGPTTSMYYRDPDGNDVETQVENFDTLEEACGFMDGPFYRENPIGTDFVPEELIRRLQSGEDERFIKKRVEIGPRMSVPI